MPDGPGDFVLLCFLPDVLGDKVPHVVHGMVAGIAIE